MSVNLSEFVPKQQTTATRNGMEKIGSNPYLNPSLAYQKSDANQAAQQIRNQNAAAKTNAVQNIVPGEASPSNYSSMFQDDQLAHLQNNLQLIASMADNALRSIDK